MLRLGGVTAGLAISTVGTRQLALAAPALPATAVRPADPPGVIEEILEQIDERYRNRRIRGVRARRRDHDRTEEVLAVTVDDADLHVMANEDGTYTSVMNHYQTFRSLRQTARAAVDSLRGADLRPFPHN
jgi:hypothetical protein